jgi:hypothetical protein
MKSQLLVTVVALLSAGVAAQSTHDAPHDSRGIQNRFVGAWKLISLEETSADGQVHKADCAGMFVFTNDGHASVQVVYRNAEAGSAYAQGGYEASYGSYHIDDSSTFHLSHRRRTGTNAHRQRPEARIPDFGKSLNCEID